MRSNRTVVLACLFIAAGLAGCGTAGNQVLVFGTDTKVALDVSGDPTGQPSFTLGYKRREAVWLPLAAGHSMTHRCIVGLDENLACTATDQLILATHICVMPPVGTPPNATVGDKQMLCLSSVVLAAEFVAKKNGNQEDAYSIITNFGLESSGSGAKIAQYLATGFAARTLAENGGAALVSSDAASPAAAKIKEMERSDIDLIVADVTVGKGIDEDKFGKLIEKTTMGEGRKKALKAEAKGKTPDEVRGILSKPRYSPFLGQLTDSM